MDSILNTVKKSLGIDEDFQTYDSNILSKINLVLTNLNSIGVGSSEIIPIESDSETWEDFLGIVTTEILESTKSHVNSQVRILFDPLKIGQSSDVTNSILNSIKKMRDVDINDDAFDTEIIADINTAFMSLTQLGVGPDIGFSIMSSVETWSDFREDLTAIEGIKSFINLKVRMLFDPPTSSFVIDAVKNEIKELEWRLQSQIEHELYVPEVTTPIGEDDD